jgi:hypothetical protein
MPGRNDRECWCDDIGGAIHKPRARRAASMAAMSIFFIFIIASTCSSKIPNSSSGARWRRVSR